MYNLYDLYDYLIGQCNAMKRTGYSGRVIAASSWQYGKAGRSAWRAFLFVGLFRATK